MDPKALALLAHFLQAMLPPQPKTQVGGMDVMPEFGLPPHGYGIEGQGAPGPHGFAAPVKSFEGPGSAGPPAPDPMFDPRMDRPPALGAATKSLAGPMPKQQNGVPGIMPRRPKPRQNVGVEKSALHSFLGSMG